MTWSINISGHGPEDRASGSAYYSAAFSPDQKSASYSGTLDEASQSALAFIRQCQAEDVPPPPAPEPQEPADVPEAAPAESAEA